MRKDDEYYKHKLVGPSIKNHSHGLNSEPVTFGISARAVINFLRMKLKIGAERVADIFHFFIKNPL